jgi:PleD family two-component response regulator
MLSDHSRALPCSRPLALIADDSRIVRATLMKHMQNLFEFVEALDGEQAWQVLLRNDDIGLLITDLTMPRLDGYGLLRRMRASQSRRIREMPVVVVSGSDDADERRRALEAGATDLIAKGMATPRLLARLDLLAQLVIAQDEYEDGQGDNRPETAQQEGAMPAATGFLGPYAFQAEAEKILRHAAHRKHHFAVFSVSLEFDAGAAPVEMRDQVCRLLKQTIRQSDLISRTGSADFTIVVVKLDTSATRAFAKRLCRAISTMLVSGNGTSSPIRACCGIATLGEYENTQDATPSLHELWDVSRRRSVAGLRHKQPMAVGTEDECAVVDS